MNNNTVATIVRKAAVVPASVVTDLGNGKVACRCSTACGATTNHLFSQGHDARLVSRLVDEVVGKRLTLDEAAVALQVAGGNVNLEAKLRRAVANAHERWTKRLEANERKARKAKAAAPAKVTAKVGRWTYEGTVRDEVFTYTDRKGVTKTTRKFTLV